MGKIYRHFEQIKVSSLFLQFSFIYITNKRRILVKLYGDKRNNLFREKEKENKLLKLIFQKGEKETITTIDKAEKRLH